MREFPPELQDAFSKLLEASQAAGDKAFVIGGFVRDWLSGFSLEDIKDIDVITELGKSDEIINYLVDKFGLGKPITYDFTGTQRLLINNFVFEFQSPTNINVHFPIQPEMEKMGIPITFLNKNIFERDFTIDCICYDISDGMILDLTDGMEDLFDNRLLRTPIDPKKAIEFNPLIILRAIRLALEFNLTPAKAFKELMPYGASLLPNVLQERSERFVQGIIQDIFDVDYEKAEKIFSFYNLFDILPMPKTILDRKVKNDMGIVYQASNDTDLLSIELDKENKKIKIGLRDKDLVHAEVREGLSEALCDLYLNNEIDEDYSLNFMGQKTPSTLFKDAGSLLRLASGESWYRMAAVSTPNVRLYDRHQRRQEYRSRKRREQKRDRVDKIKSWRNFMGRFSV